MRITNLKLKIILLSAFALSGCAQNSIFPTRAISSEQVTFDSNGCKKIFISTEDNFNGLDVSMRVCYKENLVEIQKLEGVYKRPTGGDIKDFSFSLKNIKSASVVNSKHPFTTATYPSLKIVLKKNALISQIVVFPDREEAALFHPGEEDSYTEGSYIRSFTEPSRDTETNETIIIEY